jgi:hypothetical protein
MVNMTTTAQEYRSDAMSSARRRTKEEVIAIYLHPNLPPVRVGRSWLDEDKIRKECAWQNRALWLKALPLIRDGHGQSASDPVFFH